ncbi:MAG: TorF family putative porin, partial [Candidatus Thiodiazotropha taylori]|nr:TorF family putative porin [Candidatus Thiodiazotropha taylori]MCW4292625.1 TorF family putative porin [Candidatus Thiodiazotropha taylori]
MNKIALACGVALLGLSSVAAAEISANIGVTSNYVWRGLTQSANSTAFSGGVDYAHD